MSVEQARLEPISRLLVGQDLKDISSAALVCKEWRGRVKEVLNKRPEKIIVDDLIKIFLEFHSFLLKKKNDYKKRFPFYTPSAISNSFPFIVSSAIKEYNQKIKKTLFDNLSMVIPVIK